MTLTELSTSKLDMPNAAAMKVKMFTGNDLVNTEKNLNDWLHNNPVRVLHIGQSQCERNGSLLIAISVFYSADNNN